MEYDYLNRLPQAKHVAADDGGAKIMGQYAEKITYADARGNIAAIQRYGVIPGASYPSGMIDDLSFTIKPGSNQLQRVADAAPAEFAPRGFKPTAGAQNIDYTYDPVGNQKSDPHKGITITYNYLNLPSIILWSNGNKMEISYDALGTKLSKKVSIGAAEQYTQHYLGGIEYNAVGITRKLEAIYFADGRVYNTNVTTTSTTVALRYEYAIRDHLGNTRLMFADQGTTPDGVISATEILQENHYYPFGLNMEGAWMNDAASKDSKYQYNGKELNDDFGLGWSDYGARWYDGRIGRFANIDPLVEAMPSICPYSFGYNNPITFFDPTGMVPYKYNWDSQSYEDEEGNEVSWETVRVFLENQAGASKDMAVIVAFPDESPKIPSNQKLAKWFEKTFGNGDGKYQGAGHAGIVIVDGETGFLKYFDFGRYNRPDLNENRDENEGAVRSSLNYRSLRLNFNWDFSKTDDQNVTRILTVLHQSPLLKNYGTIVGAVAKGLDFDKMLEYAQGMEGIGYQSFGGYTTSCALGNASYCAKFVRGVAGAGGMNFFTSGYSGLENVKMATRRSGTNLITVK